MQPFQKKHFSGHVFMSLASKVAYRVIPTASSTNFKLTFIHFDVNVTYFCIFFCSSYPTFCKFRIYPIYPYIYIYIYIWQFLFCSRTQEFCCGWTPVQQVPQRRSTAHMGRSTAHMGRSTAHMGRSTAHMGRPTAHMGRETAHMGR